ncbi:MAG: thioredoxin family protein [Candidatus Gracilibacteria bacterium]|nr:thioredoxin family protein [Candidatus Gracilibacteria bacterium]
MKYILFTTTQCPKCPSMKEAVAAKIAFEGEVLSEQDSNFMELAQKYQVQSAPTLVVLNGEEEVARVDDESALDATLAKVQCG